MAEASPTSAEGHEHCGKEQLHGVGVLGAGLLLGAVISCNGFHLMLGDLVRAPRMGQEGIFGDIAVMKLLHFACRDIE